MKTVPLLETLEEEAVGLVLGAIGDQGSSNEDEQ